jgi:Predicted ATPase (AAA+ superfamily)
MYQRAILQEIKKRTIEARKFIQVLVGPRQVGKFNVYYWNQGGFEVDYIIEKGNKIIAIEVKSGKDSSNKGMSLFNEEFHPQSLYTIGTNGIPFEQFLSMNPTDLYQ